MFDMDPKLILTQTIRSGNITTTQVRAGPRTLECGGASGPDPEQSNTGYDVSGVSGKGGEYERGSSSLI